MLWFPSQTGRIIMNKTSNAFPWENVTKKCNYYLIDSTSQEPVCAAPQHLYLPPDWKPTRPQCSALQVAGSHGRGQAQTWLPGAHQWSLLPGFKKPAYSGLSCCIQKMAIHSSVELYVVFRLDQIAMGKAPNNTATQHYWGIHNSPPQKYDDSRAVDECTWCQNTLDQRSVINIVWCMAICLGHSGEEWSRAVNWSPPGEWDQVVVEADRQTQWLSLFPGKPVPWCWHGDSS